MMPKPPIKNMTDFVVFCFVSIITIILVGSTIAVIIAEFTGSEDDHSQFIDVVGDVMTTIIGALIGFLAGKGQGRSEVHEEQAEKRAKEDREDQE